MLATEKNKGLSKIYMSGGTQNRLISYTGVSFVTYNSAHIGGMQYQSVKLDSFIYLSFFRSLFSKYPEDS